MTSEPFAFTSGPHDARVVVVAEAWGETEAQFKQPLVGYSGKEFFRMLGEAFPEVDPAGHAFIRSCINSESLFIKEREGWLNSAGILLTNVFALRPPANNLEALCCAKKELPTGYPYPALTKGKYLRPEFFPEIERLRSEIAQAKPNLIIALGNTAIWALLGTTNIGSIRGTVSQSNLGPKVLPTYHPAAVMRQWAWRTIVVADLMKARREAEFPEIRRPERRIIVNPTLNVIAAWRDANVNAPRIAFDIETARRQITMIGFSARPDEALVVPFINERPPWNYWPELSDELDAWHLCRDILTGPAEKVAQNGLYDLQYLWRVGIRPRNCSHDTMLLHHALLPELQKSLGFMGSVYSSEPAWKIMRSVKETIKRDE